MVVDLPAPLGPRNPVTTPGRTSKLSPSTATVAPKRLLRPRTWIMGAPYGPCRPRGTGLPPVLAMGISATPEPSHRQS